MADSGGSAGNNEEREEELRIGERKKERDQKKKVKGRCVNSSSQFAI